MSEAIIISNVIKNFFGNLYSNKKGAPKIQIEIFKPNNLTDAQKIIDSLMEDIPAVVSLENTDEGKVKQIIDFISGKAFAAGCKMEKINEKIFIFTPKNINIEAVE